MALSILIEYYAPVTQYIFLSENMPTVMRIGPYRFFFYAGDRDEPMHIHVERDTALAKFWLVPVRLQHSIGFARSGLVKIEQLVVEHRENMIEAWNDYFAN